MVVGQGQKIGRQKHGYRRPKEPHEPQDGPGGSPKIAILRCLKQSPQRHGQDQGLGAPLHQNDRLSRQNGLGRPIRPLGEQGLGHRGPGPILDALAQCPGGEERVGPNPGQPLFHLEEQGVAAYAAQIAQGQIHVVFAANIPKFAHEVRPPDHAPKEGDADAEALMKGFAGSDDRALVLGRAHASAGVAPGVEEHRLSLPLQQHRRTPLHDGFLHLSPAVRLLRLLKGKDLPKGIFNEILFARRQGAFHGPLDDKIADLVPIRHAVEKDGQGVHLSAEPEGAQDEVRIHLAEECLDEPPPALFEANGDGALIRRFGDGRSLFPLKEGRLLRLRFQELESAVRFVKAEPPSDGFDDLHGESVDKDASPYSLPQEQKGVD